MMNRLAALTFWCAAAFAFVMAVRPPVGDPHLSLSDKALHAAAFAVLAALAAVAFRRAALWRIALGLLAFGGLIEIVQGLPIVGRDADVRDLVADAAGIAFSLPLSALVLRRWRATASATAV